MTDVLAARSQMAMSLAFHIIFAAVGIGMPVLMVAAEWRWRVTGDATYLDPRQALVQSATRDHVCRWCRIGNRVELRAWALVAWLHAVRGGDYRYALLARGGLPSSLRRFSSAMYLYGWEARVRPEPIWAAGVAVAVSGTLSCDLRGDRQRLDELPDWLPDCGWRASRYRSDRGDA